MRSHHREPVIYSNAHCLIGLIVHLRLSGSRSSSSYGCRLPSKRDPSAEAASGKGEQRRHNENPDLRVVSLIAGLRPQPLVAAANQREARAGRQ